MQTAKRGQVLVLFVLALIVLIGFAALGIDVAYMFSVRHELQRSADAGALAGAYVFNDGDWSSGSTPPEPMRTKAVQRAQDAATSDPVGAAPLSAGDVDPPTFPSVNPNRIQVTVHRNVNLFFAGMIGVPAIALTATATAEAVRVDQNVECLKPLAVPLPYVDSNNNERWNSGERVSYDCGPGSLCQGMRLNRLRIVNDSSLSGSNVRDNSGRLFALGLCGNGSVGNTTYQHWIQDWCTETCPGGGDFVATVGSWIPVKTYQPDSLIRGGLGPLISGDSSGATFNRDPTNYPNLPGSDDYNGPNWINSPRVLRVVLYDPSYVGSHSDTRIQVWGFAGFWINRVYSDRCDPHPVCVRWGPHGCREWRTVYNTCHYVDGYFIPDSAVGAESANPRLIEPSVKMTRLVK